MVEVVWRQFFGLPPRKNEIPSLTALQDRLRRCIDGYNLTPTEIDRITYLSRGNQHTAVTDGEFVYKLPNKRRSRRLEMSYDAALDEETKAKAYFGILIPETTVLKDRYASFEGITTDDYVIKQRLLKDPQPVYPETMSKEDIRKQFIALLRRNRYLIDYEHSSIAFLGREGTMTTIGDYVGPLGRLILHLGSIGEKRLTNVLVEEGKNLGAVDYDFLDLSSRRQRAEYAFNRYVIKRHFLKRMLPEEFDRLLPPLWQIPKHKNLQG